ncbi:DegT/DnrJ/EryC1/StrS aminotransferase family protein [Methanomicrobium sp. W14]|uniref:DegT/DnrJ/EryC1/StrS family aminotransferase n=1 Tax=Methanomicrobium sp. W14 TaxID=2817839 RepID=UPI001AEB6CA6|nr:DegT/DnrJ/EryC1/StrS family aminotransferase [Methanomicrobium sp. W14]
MIPIAKPLIQNEEISAVTEVLRSGKLASGSKVKEFEERFADYCNTDFAVATNSGTSALHTALLAENITHNDEVIVPDFSFVATASSVLMCGAKPVFADINMDTYNIDYQNIEDLITSKTKAIICVHLFGNPCDMDKLIQIANEHDLAIIEDAAQAHGSKYHNKKAGSLGDAGCFSFYATKNMTTGEGGMITTSDPEVYEKAKKIIDHGQKGRYLHEILGYNYRMTDIAAAIGIEQLKKLDKFNSERQNNARRYNEKLNADGIIKPHPMDNCEHVYHQYAIRVTEDYSMSREELIEYLRNNEIITAVHYPSCISSQPLFNNKEPDNSTSNRLSKEILSLPVHPSVKENEIKFICDLINEA